MKKVTVLEFVGEYEHWQFYCTYDTQNPLDAVDFYMKEHDLDDEDYKVTFTDGWATVDDVCRARLEEVYPIT